MARNYYTGIADPGAGLRGFDHGIERSRGIRRAQADEEWQREERDHLRGIRPLQRQQAELGLEGARVGLESSQLGLEDARRRHEWAGEDRPLQRGALERQDQAGQMQMDDATQNLERAAVLEAMRLLQNNQPQLALRAWQQFDPSYKTAPQPDPNNPGKWLIDLDGDGNLDSVSPDEVIAAYTQRDSAAWTRLNDTTIFDKGTGTFRDMGGPGGGMTSPRFGTGGISPFNYQTEQAQIARAAAATYGGGVDSQGQFFVPPGREEEFNLSRQTASNIARLLFQNGMPGALAPEEIASIAAGMQRHAPGLTSAQAEKMAREELSRGRFRSPGEDQVAARAREIQIQAMQQYEEIVYQSVHEALSGGMGMSRSHSRMPGADPASATQGGGAGMGVGSPAGAGMQVPQGPVGAPAAPPAPRDPSQRTVGQVYTAPNGQRIRWTGRDWEVVEAGQR